MSSFSENIAHFANGMAFMFFVLLSVQLYQHRNRNHLMKFFFWEMLFFSFLEFSNMIYLIEGVWDDDYLSNISLIFDSWSVPITALFLFEIISPGWNNLRKGIIILIPSIFFLTTYILLPTNALFYASVLYSNVFGILSVIVVCLASSKYDNYIKKHFSYTENISLYWLRWIIIPLYISLFIWMIIIWEPSWLGDAFYYVFTIIVWMFIYHHVYKHAIIEVPDLLNPFVQEKKDVFESTNNLELENGFLFTQRLETCMETACLYLNPKLSITDLAVAIGTNRTYLSDYLNKQLHTTFYEYINSFRIRKACELLRLEENQNLEVLAESCGFNSLSTFRRSFQKEMGITPMQYKKRNIQ